MLFAPTPAPQTDLAGCGSWGDRTAAHRARLVACGACTGRAHACRQALCAGVPSRRDVCGLPHLAHASVAPRRHPSRRDTTAVAQRHVTPRERQASSPPPSSSSHEPPRPCPVAANQYSPLRLSVASRVSPRPRCGRVELRGRGSRRKRDRALEQVTNGAATIAEYPAARGEGDERVATGE